MSDPFARTKVPSLSWKGAEVGTELTIVLDGPARLVEFGNWPDGKPKSHAIVSGQVRQFTHDPSVVGDARSLWATVPGALHGAIADAQAESGHALDNGSVLYVKFTAEIPTKKGNPRREFKAKHTPSEGTDVPVPDEPEDDGPPF